MGGKIPLRIEPEFFFVRRYPRPNHVFQIWWWLVQGFSVSWGSNFAIPHWLWRSSLQHSHTTLWACDAWNLWTFRRIIKTVATRRRILKLKCTKFDSSWGFAPDPACGAYSPPLPGFPNWISWAYFWWKERRGERDGWEEMRGMEGAIREGQKCPVISQSN